MALLNTTVRIQLSEPQKPTSYCFTRIP